MNNLDNNRKFPGFPPEPVTNYWPYPKALNGWWHILSAYEQKVIDYILRHTWGYKKDSDAISYSQFMNGIVKRDGTVIDKGTGIKDERTIRKALKGLVSKGFIERKDQIGRESIFILKINPSQDMMPPTKDDTPLPATNVRGTSSQDMSPTIKDITIKDNNNYSAARKNENSSKGEIDQLINYLIQKLGGNPFPNYGKQAKFTKSMLSAGYSTADICSAIDRMFTNEWWKEHSFDMKNVSDQIPKLMAKTIKERNLALHPRPIFVPCGNDGCEGGFIRNVKTNSSRICMCNDEYQQKLERWKQEYE